MCVLLRDTSQRKGRRGRCGFWGLGEGEQGSQPEGEAGGGGEEGREGWRGGETPDGGGGAPPPHPPPPLLTSGYSCRRMGISGRNGLGGLEWREEGGMLGGERKHEMGWIATPTVHRKVG